MGMAEKDIRELIKQLNDSDPEVRQNAAVALGKAAERGQDITPAIPALGNALSDEDKNVRREAVFALKEAAKKGQDITPAIPAFGNASDKGGFVRWLAAEALGEAAENGQDITPAVPALGNALSDRDGKIRLRAVEVLKYAAKKGQDITPAVPALGNALSDKDVSEDAAGALVYHYVNNGEWNKVEKLFGHENKDVRWGAARALEYAAKKCESIETLNEIQKILEDSFAEWLKKQPQGPSPEKVKRMFEIANFVKLIAHQKAELSKQDGELLLGETVKKPSDSGKKIYQSLRRVSRNG